MDPSNTNQIPSMELPNLPAESQQALSELSQASSVTESGAAQALEQGVSQSATPTSSPVFDTNLGPQPAVSTAFDPSQTVAASLSTQISSTMPAIADDNDLIEKEWVEKAKQIVEHTKADPHLQNKEMNKVKIDYLKKRYNKEVKLVEE